MKKFLSPLLLRHAPTPPPPPLPPPSDLHPSPIETQLGGLGGLRGRLTARRESLTNMRDCSGFRPLLARRADSLLSYLSEFYVWFFKGYALPGSRTIILYFFSVKQQ